MHDENFREKVAMAEHWISGLRDKDQVIVRQSMLMDFTREQAMTYYGTCADIAADGVLEGDERATLILEARGLAAEMWDELHAA
jgi:hypothetical protein